MYTSIGKALEKINYYTAYYTIDCNIGFHSSITYPNWFAYQTKINCKDLTLYTSKYLAEAQAPKEFFENNNVIIQSNVTTKYI